MSITMSQTPSSGDLIVGCFFEDSSGAGNANHITSITETGVSWSLCVFNSVYNPGAGIYQLDSGEIWAGDVQTSSASTSITVAFNASSTSGEVGDVCEYSGINLTYFPDKTSSNTANIDNAVTGTTPTTSKPDELIIGMVGNHYYGQSTPTNGFTLLDGTAIDSGGINAVVGYLENTVTSTGQYSSGTTITGGSNYYAGCIATFIGTSQTYPSVTKIQGNCRGATVNQHSSTVSDTLTSTPVYGDLLIATVGTSTVSTDPAANVASITETGVTWTYQVGQQVTLSGEVLLDVEIWAGVVGGGASTSVTVNLANTAVLGAVVDISEYQGLTTSGFLEASSSDSSQQGLNPSTGAISTSQSNSLIIGATVTGGYSQTNPTNSFTLSDGAAQTTGATFVSLSYLELDNANVGIQSSGTTINSNYPWAGVIASFVRVPVSSYVSITFSSSPSGSGYITLNGNPISTPTTLNLVPGSVYTVAANTPIYSGSSREVFSSWSDSGAQSHSYTVPGSSATLTANFQLQYYLDLASPMVSYSTSNDDSWSMFRHDAQGTATSLTSTAPTANSVLWQFNDLTGNNYGSVAIANGIIYVPSDEYHGNSQGVLYALNAFTGTQIWSCTDSSGQFQATPAVANGLVYAGSSDGNVYAFNAATGSVTWTYTAGGAIESSITYANSMVYFGAHDNCTYALNANTGAFVWKHTTLTCSSIIIGASPVVANGILYTGDSVYYQSNENLYALNAATGATVWTDGNQFELLSSPLVENGVVYVHEDGSVSAFNATTGVQIWSINNNNNAFGSSSVALANGLLYYCDEAQDTLNAVSASTGASVWTFVSGAPFLTNIESSPVVSNGYVYFGNTQGVFYCVNAATGALVWSYQSGSVFWSSPALYDGIVYEQNTNGILYAFGSLPSTPVASQSGSQTSDNWYNSGSTATITALPSYSASGAKYQFVNYTWSLDGVTQKPLTTASTTITMSNYAYVNVAVQAVWLNVGSSNSATPVPTYITPSPTTTTATPSAPTPAPVPGTWSWFNYEVKNNLLFDGLLIALIVGVCAVFSLFSKRR